MNAACHVPPKNPRDYLKYKAFKRLSRCGDSQRLPGSVTNATSLAGSRTVAGSPASAAATGAVIGRIIKDPDGPYQSYDSVGTRAGGLM